MKEIISSFTAYNIWANQKIIDTLKTVPAELLNAGSGGSFSSIKKTIYHIWDAQVIWLSRLQGISLSCWPSAEYSDDFEGYDVYFIQQCIDFDRFVNSRPASFFEDTTYYRNLKGEELRSRNGDIILHCMNHSTYHRGQIITYLRQGGITELPSTDYIFYKREIG